MVNKKERFWIISNLRKCGRGLSKNSKMGEDDKKKKETVEPFIRANPHTGRWEPESIENYLNHKYKPKK